MPKPIMSTRTDVNSTALVARFNGPFLPGQCEAAIASTLAGHATKLRYNPTPGFSFSPAQSFEAVHDRPDESGTLAERYEALIDLGHFLTGILRPADVHEAVGGRLSRALPLESFFISRLEDTSVEVAIIHRSDAGIGGESSYGATDCLAIRDRRPVLHLPGDAAAACRAADVDSRNRPAISAPVMRYGKPIGVLTVLGRTGTVYDTSDLEFVAAIADMLAPALGAAGHGRDNSGRELDALDPITRAVAGLSIDDALERTARAAHDLSAADGTAIWLVRSGGEVEATHSQGAISPRRGEKLALSHELFRELAGRREAMPFDNRKETGGSGEEFRKLTRGSTGVVVPLHAQDRVLGALVTCFRGSRMLTTDALNSLSRMASIAAIAAGYARLNDQINALSMVDPLTGIPNRRHLAMYLEKEFAAARRGRRLTVLLFDIDDFEKYNRGQGRQAGDAVLRAFAEMLVAQTRAMNLAARFEGDAFIVALADADRRAGFIHASRIARAAEAHPLVGPSGVHASVGIASYAPRMKTFEDLLQAAVRDLEARRTGGGRLTI
jgi:diguanylate cyclase (GGDEF)-like protein